MMQSLLEYSSDKASLHPSEALHSLNQLFDAQGPLAGSDEHQQQSQQSQQIHNNPHQQPMHINLPPRQASITSQPNLVRTPMQGGTSMAGGATTYSPQVSHLNIPMGMSHLTNGPLPHLNMLQQQQQQASLGQQQQHASSSPSAGAMAAPSMIPQHSQQGSSSTTGASANTSPNVAAKRRRSQIKAEDEGGGPGTDGGGGGGGNGIDGDGHATGPARNRVKASPRVGSNPGINNAKKIKSSA